MMKKRLLACLMSVSMVFTLMYGNAVAAESSGQEKIKDEQEKQEIMTPSDADQIIATGSDGKPAENLAAAKTEIAMYAENSGPVYEVGTPDELTEALEKISEDSENSEATVELTNDVTVPRTSESGYITEFGVDGKHITVCSDGETKHKFNFLSRGILTGDCTFDNVDVIGMRIYCNGYRTIFTENGEIHLLETLYGGGYKTTVDSTYVVIAASGYINPSSSSGLHNVIGGSYQGSVEGDTYLEITGDIQMQGGNHLNPGCVMGDGSSGDGKNSPDVYVGGNATLIYDNENAETSPAIEGTYGCEMMGDVILNVCSGRATGICGQNEYPTKSRIHGDLHIIAGAEEYEYSDRVLRMPSSDYSCWPIIGAGNYMPNSGDVYTVDGNVTIDAYENVWGWDKGTTPPKVVPMIMGAKSGHVGKNIVLNIHGSHMGGLEGAEYSTVDGDITINFEDAELRDAFYETQYDDGNIFGYDECTVTGKTRV